VNLKNYFSKFYDFKKYLFLFIFCSYSSLAEFLTITSGRDDPFYLPGHLDEKEAQKGMPEE
jgi:hypothetical protein